MSLGKQIRHYREARQLTLEALAELSGVDVGTISALENRGSQRSKFASSIARGLGLTVDQLLDESRDWVKTPPAHKAPPPAPSSPLGVGEPPPADYDRHLPRGLTTAERDVVESYRQLPERRQAELRESMMAEARQYLADFRELAARHRAGTHASPERVAEALPVRPDGEQPNTEPGGLD